MASFTVVGDDKGHISILWLIREVWKSRGDAAKIVRLTDVFCECCDERETCVEMESYLPQLVHLTLMIGSDGKGKNQTVVEDAMERVLLTLAQVSVHAAMRLVFILSAAMEDYQPENSSGEPNYSKDDDLFYRCARIVQNVERSAIYGTPILRAGDEKNIKDTHGVNIMLESTVKEKKNRLKRIMESNNARELTRGEAEGAHMSRLAEIDDEVQEGMHGNLLFKRKERKSIFHSHKWKWRYFRIEQGVLFCTRKPDAKTSTGGIMRTLSLSGCTIDTEAAAAASVGSQHPFVIVVSNSSSGMVFQLRAANEEEFKAWTTALEKECYGEKSFPYPLPSSSGSNNTNKKNRSNSLRRKRSLAYSLERKFLTDITDICERLRFIDRPLRMAFMKRDIKRLQVPPFAYIPLVDSTDTFSYCLRAIPSKAYAFRTKARCPMLVYFETEEHPKKADVATFFNSEVHEYDDSEILTNVRNIVKTEDGGDDDSMEEENSVESAAIAGDEAPSRLKMDLSPTGPWREAGAGAGRLSDVKLVQEVVMSPTLTLESSEDKAAYRSQTSSHYSASADLLLRQNSPYSHLEHWGVEGFIAKSNDDLRQEMFVMQLITYFRNIFTTESDKLWLKSYHVLSITQRTGIIQLIKRSSSLDAVKKGETWPGSLRGLFIQRYGVPGDHDPALKPGYESPRLKQAIQAFVSSMAAYSIVSYLIGIKDRHNGNMMLDDDGHIIHIDFGFVFGLAPGKAASMETCPFKLTVEMVDLMGGDKSPHFDLYKKLCGDAYLISMDHADALSDLVDMMAYRSEFPCFRYNRHAAMQFRNRIMRHRGMKKPEVDKFIDQMVGQSWGHTGTGLYDDFQVLTNGIKK